MPPTNHSTTGADSRLLEPLLHAGFALTGAGTVLLGCILPRLSSEWHLRDKDAGLLLLIQFAASAAGALFIRRNFWKTLCFGYLLFGAGAIGIFLLQQISIAARGLAFAVCGLGLGMAMTSTNMLIGRRHVERRGAALAILNFSWSAGAVACPLLIAQFFRHTAGGTAFGLLGLIVLPFAFLPLLAHRSHWTLPHSDEATPSGIVEATTILYYAALAFLYVGIEATIGNWMSTYATRATPWHFDGGSLAVAIFWATFLLGRAITPAILTLLAERMLYRIAVVAALLGVGCLLAAQNERVLLAASALLGFALAPLFPLTLSLFLAEIGKSQNAGWVFGIAGLGGAVLSWLTGSVSTSSGSLRIALLVPASATVLLLLMIALRRSPATSALQNPQPGQLPASPSRK